MPQKKQIAVRSSRNYISVQNSGIIIKKVKLISVRQLLRALVGSEVKRTSLCLNFWVFLQLIQCFFFFFFSCSSLFSKETIIVVKIRLNRVI